MDLTLRTADLLATSTPLLVVPVARGVETLGGPAAAADEALGGAFLRARSAGDFRGKEEDGLLFYREGEGPKRILFQGIGAEEELSAERIRGFAARGVRRAESLSLTELTIAVPMSGDDSLEVGARTQAAAEGACLAAWDFRELRSQPQEDEDPPPPLVSSVTLYCEPDDGEEEELREGLRWGRAVAEGENFARVLQWRPGNVATPTHLAEVAEQLAQEHGFEVEVMGPAEMEEEGMGALLAVAAGSDQEPRLILLEHRGGGEGDAPLVLVGKGLTFDTGGVSIKPAAGMEEMKYDMSGGAAVLGAMRAVGLLDLPMNVVGVVPASENHISGSATKPGDVIRSREGKTVEVINTDAEGRLILADALSYAKDRYGPAAMVDCATLTGAVVVGLGHHAAGLLGNDDDLIAELRAAGDRSGERCWPLPLWKEYRKQLDSSVADLKNVGGRAAGTITAAHFLQEFVGSVPWAHLDIAGTAYGEPRAPYHRKGGFGFPTRLLVEWLRSRVR